VRSSRESASEADSTAVLNAAAEARNAIADFKAVKTAMTQATKSVERAKTGVETIERALLDRLERIEGAVEEAMGDDPKAERP
ncbi:MAG: hypothetical protein H0V15_07235, partial [Solirubrobacterales bacterium]|nr:hypothetical protein [Solirubrobacterales bacterium]